MLFTLQIDKIKFIFANKIKSYLLFSAIFKIYLTMEALVFGDLQHRIFAKIEGSINKLIIL